MQSLIPLRSRRLCVKNTYHRLSIVFPPATARRLFFPHGRNLPYVERKDCRRFIPFAYFIEKYRKLNIPKGIFGECDGNFTHYFFGEGDFFRDL